MGLAFVGKSTELFVSSGTSGTITYTPAAGSLLVCVCSNEDDDTHTFTVSDSNNTWTKDESNGTPAANGLISVHSAPDVAGTPTTFIVTASAAINFRAMLVEFSGAPVSSPVAAIDKLSSSAGGNTHTESSAGLTVATQVVVIAACAESNHDGGETAGAGYTSFGFNGSAGFTYAQYGIFSSITNESGSWTSVSPGIHTDGVIVAYNAATSPAVGLLLSRRRKAIAA